MGNEKPAGAPHPEGKRTTGHDNASPSIARDQANQGPSSTPHEVQHAWLRSQRGKPIRVRLLDGKAVTSELVAYDTYSLLIRTEPSRVLLIYKHAAAALAPHDSAGGGQP